MPRHVDTTASVGRDRAAAVEICGLAHQVALSLERILRWVQPRIQHRHAGTLRSRIRWRFLCRAIRPVPGHVQSAVPAERDLSAADGAGRHRASCRAVYSDGWRKRGSAVGGPNIEHVGRARLASQIDHVDRSSAIRHQLRLHGATREAHNVDRNILTRPAR